MKKLSIILAFILLLSCFAFTSQALSVNTLLMDVNTIDVEKQNAIQRQVDFIQEDKSITDKEKLAQLVKLFFEAKKLNFENDTGNIDFSIFLNDCSNNKFNCNKIINLFKTEKCLRQGNKIKIAAGKMKCNIHDIDIQDNSAKVTLYVSYSFQYSNLSEKSSTGINYTVNFNKINDRWLINSIETDDETFVDELGLDSYDPLENVRLIQSYSEEPLDAKTLNFLKQGEGNYQAALKNENIKSRLITLSLSLTPINRSNASWYAYNFTNNDGAYSETNYNTLFPSYNPYDCQNFVSQCVWYGLGGVNSAYNINNKLFPMVTTGSARWYQSGTLNDQENWTSCGNFWNLLLNSASSAPFNGGIYGLSINSSVAYAEPGDAIQIKLWNSTTQQYEWSHTYIVYNVTGTYGAQTPATIYVCAHTANRQNVLLSNIFNKDSSYYRTVKIWGIYS